jgi:hypothetical protein
MPGLDLHLSGDNAWPELKEKEVIRAYVNGIAALPKGTVEGRPSVTVRIDLPDGRTVLAETTLRLLLRAAEALAARYGRQF